MSKESIRQKVLFSKRQNPMFTVQILALVCGCTEDEVREVLVEQQKAKAKEAKDTAELNQMDKEMGSKGHGAEPVGGGD